MQTAAANPAPDRGIHAQVVLFHTQWGAYTLTRFERYRLAKLHGLGDVAATALAYDRAELPEGPVAAQRVGTFSADDLARRFDAEGRALQSALPTLRMIPPPIPADPALPRVAGAGRAGA